MTVILVSSTEPSPIKQVMARMRLAALFEQSFVPFFLGGLVSLITITNPVPKIPLFMTLAGDMGEAQRNEQARRACVYAFVILAVSLFAGVLQDMPPRSANHAR